MNDSWAKRFPAPDQQPLPKGGRWSYIIFILALITVGVSLILNIPNILPWKLPPVTSILFGWMFIGDAFYFGYALWNPRWTNGEAQLWSFLAYDLVLIGPFLTKLPTVEPQFFQSLIVYIGILIFSGTVAVYFLFLNPSTRCFKRLAAPTASTSIYDLIVE